MSDVGRDIDQALTAAGMSTVRSRRRETVRSIYANVPDEVLARMHEHVGREVRETSEALSRQVARTYALQSALDALTGQLAALSAEARRRA